MIPNSDFYEGVKSVTKEKTKTELIIEQIHEDFYSEVDKLLKYAKIKNDESYSNPTLVDKANRLRSLGFSSTKESKESFKDEARVEELKRENARKEGLREAILYFSNKYPMYKFITEDSVKKICKKYGLVYGDVSKYIGSVPEKNLREIENFKIEDKDICARSFEEYFSLNGSDIISERLVPYKGKNESIIDTRHNSSSIISYIKHEILPLEIAAPLKDFKMEDSEIKDFKVSKIEIPDPVVLQPIHFKGSKHYLIVTAWGLEAEDELVINPTNN